MRVLALASVFVAACFLASCAPRNNKTHFDRWAEQTQKRKEEDALKEKEQEWVRSMITGKAMAPAMSRGPGDTPRATSGGGGGGGSSNYSSLGGSRTSTGSSSGTKSRVIKPSDQPKGDDDEAIY